MKADSYLQNTDQIYIMEAGILKNYLEFAKGKSHSFTYDFQNPEYPKLKERYGIEKCAGEGSELDKAIRLMSEYSPRLTHKSYYDNHIAFNALDLLEYSLDKPENGINCRAKAQILNEMCLALGIYSRKVWLMPNSVYDNDCHVVNEIWDSGLNKWVMLDITNNKYWVDDKAKPLSVLEIRKKGGEQEFCTPAAPGDSLDDPQLLKTKHIADFLYIMKNMCYTEYCSDYGIGEIRPIYRLFPKCRNNDYEFLIDEDSVNTPPVGMEQLNEKKYTAALIITVMALILSVALNIYLVFFSQDSYLQSTDEIYIMEAGIIKNHHAFAEGKTHIFTYDFQNPEYQVLKEKYDIEKCAGDGSELEKAIKLMTEYSPRLTHKSNYDNHIAFNALDLLEYSLDISSNGINCRAKAQILNEMCLALGIYSRKVWIMPNSKYDGDCHVVNEIWDSRLNKWVMLDITNNQYWVDESGNPLSVLEIRQKGGEQEFLTPVVPGESLDNLYRLKKKHIGEFLYIMKNMCYMEYCSDYGAGETMPFYLLIPKGLNDEYEHLISEDSVNAPPVGVDK